MGLTSPGTLPAVPVSPEAELVAWVRERMRSLLERRDVIRTCMAEVSQVPERAGPVAERPVQMARELATYLREMQARGMADPAVNASAAAAMLMGAMFTDVMTRDMMPDRFGYTQADAPALYTGLLLRAVGAAPQPARGPAPRLRRTNTNDERRPS